MARWNPGLPRPPKQAFNKSKLLEALVAVDADASSNARVLSLENKFLQRIQTHVESLPARDAKFKKFTTNPFVLMIHCMNKGFSRVSQLEIDILPGKQFSSIETSAGRMVEEVTLSAYGWEAVPSEMHSANSTLDGKRLDGDTLRVVTLKSGPRCLNDTMTENFAKSIIDHHGAWAEEAHVRKIDFTYGVLYGTPCLSNKKDWHILRKISEKMPSGTMTVAPDGRWDCAFSQNGIDVKVTVRIGSDWWTYLGGERCLTELCAAMIRACVRPGEADPANQMYAISDLAQIVSTAMVPANFNVAILQRTQIPWLFFLARHFCDVLEEE